MTDQERRDFFKSAAFSTSLFLVSSCARGQTAQRSLVQPSPAPPATPTDPIQFALSSPASSPLAPFCLGYAFRKGHVPAGQTLVSNLANLQVTPKNRWPDGSLKFAVIAGTVALTANTPLTASLSTGTAAAALALTTSHLRATNITATVTCGAFGTAAWAATDWDAPFQVWVSGPQMSSWRYRKTVGTDEHLVAWLEVRLFAGGAVEVLPWLENGFLRVAGPTNKAARFGFDLGNTQRFSAAIDLPNHCRTPLVAGATLSYWLGVDPQVTIKHDTAYLQATALLPSYRATVPADSAAINALVTTHAPLQQGNHSPAMGTAGYHGSIGLLADWDVLHLTSASQKAYAGLIVNVAQSNNPFGWVAPYSDFTGAGDGVYFEAAWTLDSYTAAFGYAKAMEPALPAASGQRLTEFFAWKAQSIVGRLGGTQRSDYLYADAAQYTMAVAPTDTPDFVTGAGPWHANWGAIYAATMKAPNPGVATGLRGGNFPEATSYWGNLQPAIAYAVQHQVPGAVEAYRRMTSAANWHQLASGFHTDPVWSVRPMLEN